MNRSQDRGFFAPGLILLLTVLLVVMMATFSLLSLSTARADHERAQLLAQRTDEWYAAQNRATEILRQLRAGDPVDLPIDRADGTLCFDIPIRQGQTLRVTLREADLALIGYQTVPDNQ